MKRLIAIVVVTLCGLAILPAQGQVLRCTDKMKAIPDDLMQRSVDTLKLKFPDISFQADDQPCRHADETVWAFQQTLSRNHLQRIDGYEFVKILNGEGYLTIERFKGRDPKDLQRMELALKGRTSDKLKIKANTNYAYFVAGDSMYFMVSSSVGRPGNAAIFQQFQQAVLPAKPKTE